MNQIVIIGRLTRDVEMRYVPETGMPVANFTVAVDRDYKDKDGNRATDFLDVQVWNKQAQSCEQCLSKGSLVCVNGSVRVESYEDRMGNKRRAWRINANRVQFLSPKSNSTHIALDMAIEDINKGNTGNVPSHLKTNSDNLTMFQESKFWLFVCMLLLKRL